MLSLITTSFVLANTIPLPTNSLSTENGGTLSAIDAYSDGIGITVSTNKGTQLNNSPLNTLVYKYGTAAKTNNTDLKSYVLTNGTTVDKTLANQLSASVATPVATIPANGTACNDGNSNTTNDMYVNGICIGSAIPTTPADGTPCDDGNPNTFNDQYHSGACYGLLPLNGTPCDDGNPNTTQDAYFDGVCTGQFNSLPIGSQCNDNDPTTYNDIIIDNFGVCRGVRAINGMSCDDGNWATVKDTWVIVGNEAWCVGVYPGSPCDDGNVVTQYDSYDGAGNCTPGWEDCNNTRATCYDRLSQIMWYQHFNSNTGDFDPLTECDGNLSTIGDYIENGSCISGWQTLEPCNNGESFPNYVKNPNSMERECMANIWLP